MERKTIPKKAFTYNVTHLQTPTGYYSAKCLSDETVTLNYVSFVMKGVQGGVLTMGAISEHGKNADKDF